jgi:hypothetical protein
LVDVSTEKITFIFKVTCNTRNYKHDVLHWLYSQASLGRTRISRTLWMTRIDLKVPSIFLVFLSKKKTFCLNTDTSNSINDPVNDKITSLTCQIRTFQFN